MSHYKGDFVLDAKNHPWNKVFDMINEGSVVLDIGCSTGNFGAALIEHKNCIVDGIEPDAGDYNKAKRVLRRVANGFAEEALKSSFKNQKYDYVVFLDVVEHLYNPVATLKLVKSNLKKGGSIIFSIPNMAHVSVRLMLLKGNFEYGETGLLDKTHLHFYTLREIERVFADAGYIISRLDNTEATYPPALITDQLRRLGIRKTPKLERLLNKDDARAFQYIGEAVVAKVRNIPRQQFSPDAQGTISLWYQEHLQKRDKNLDILSSQIADYEESLRRIKQSKSYRVGRFMTAPYRMVQKFFKED